MTPPRPLLTAFPLLSSPLLPLSCPARFVCERRRSLFARATATSHPWRSLHKPWSCWIPFFAVSCVSFPALCLCIILHCGGPRFIALTAAATSVVIAAHTLTIDRSSFLHFYVLANITVDTLTLENDLTEVCRGPAKQAEVWLHHPLFSLQAELPEGEPLLYLNANTLTISQQGAITSHYVYIKATNALIQGTITASSSLPMGLPCGRTPIPVPSCDFFFDELNSATKKARIWLDGNIVTIDRGGTLQAASVRVCVGKHLWLVGAVDTR